MKKKITLSLLLFISILSFSQDKIILNDSTIVNCKIHNISKNIIRLENFQSLQTECISTDTIHSFIYDGITHNTGCVYSPLFDYSDPNNKSTIYKLSFLTPAFCFESKINYNTTAAGEVGFGFSYKSSGSEFRFIPHIKMELRHYHNFKGRQKNRKSIKNYSGNYFSFFFAGEDLSFIAGPTYGIQRNMNRFYFNIQAGAGLQFLGKMGASEFENILNPIIMINIGRLLSNSRHKA